MSEPAAPYPHPGHTTSPVSSYVGGHVSGHIRTVLRLEGLAVLIVCLLFYERQGLSWGVFALTFLAPDLAFFGYLLGARAGALAYNTTHSYLGALLCLGAGLWWAVPLWQAVGLIWCAHVGFDRALGYGLKYAQGFVWTHLGRIGKQPH